MLDPSNLGSIMYCTFSPSGINLFKLISKLSISSMVIFSFDFLHEFIKIPVKTKQTKNE